MSYLFPYAGSVEKIRLPRKRATVKKEVPKIPVVVPPSPLSLKKILFEVADAHEIHPNILVAKGHAAKAVAARAEFIWRARQELNASFPRIAMAINRDHTTVIHHYYCLKAAKDAGYEKRRKPKHKQSPKEQGSELTERQKEILELSEKGYTIYQISAEIGVSPTMVKREKLIAERICGDNARRDIA